jgi:putative endonuclease
VPVRIQMKRRHGISDKQYYVYILTTENNNVLYTGVTNDLIRRVYEHKNGLFKGFKKTYYVHKLVYYEVADDVMSAIEREKQIKGWGRQKKIVLLNFPRPYGRGVNRYNLTVAPILRGEMENRGWLHPSP